MANEIKVTNTITYENGQLKYTYQPGTLQLPQSSQGYETQTITATSAEAAVSFGSLTTPGVLVLQSLQATTTGQDIDYGVTSTTGGMGNPMGTLRPKESHILRLNSTSTLRIQNADAAAGNFAVQVICFEN